MIEPKEVCSELHKLQIMRSSYETMRYRGIGKNMKILLNNLIIMLKNDWPPSGVRCMLTGLKCAHN